MSDPLLTDADWAELFPLCQPRHIMHKIRCVEREIIALRADKERLERENTALRDARRVAEQVCAEAFAKVFADYAANTLTKDTQP